MRAQASTGEGIGASCCTPSSADSVAAQARAGGGVGGGVLRRE